jgi:hypothetical protein
MKESNQTADVPSYPLGGFPSALEVARAVSEAGGAKADVQKAIIASHLQTSHTSGAFLQRLASARSYRMIAGRGSYRLTPTGVSYFLPASDSDSKRALLSFLASPPTFAEIIKRFDGTRLPSVEMLGNVLHREMGVSDSWKSRVASFFIKAAQAAGVVDSQGFLRYRAALQTMESEPQNHSIEAAQESESGFQMMASPPSHRPVSDGMDALVFSVGAQTVRLETPKGDLSRPLWEKLNKFVKALEPSDSK